MLAGEARADWVDAVGSEVAALLRMLRHRFAAASLAAGDPGAAVPLARAAATDDPLDDRAHRLLMAAHHADGEPGLALATFERLRTALADELGADPAHETRALRSCGVNRSHRLPGSPRGRAARYRRAARSSSTG